MKEEEEEQARLPQSLREMDPPYFDAPVEEG